MRYLVVAFAALLLLACGALEAFDAAPPPILVSGLQEPPGGAIADGQVQHSGVLRATNAAGLAEIAPPDRFQADNAAIVIFGHADVIEALCGARNADGTGPIACAGKKDGNAVIAAPNPCIAATVDVYAAILCHELGHVNGWPKEHGD